MAISASSIASSATLNQLRTQFNNLVTDVTAIEGGSISYTTLNTTTTNATTLNVKEDGTIVFEGATDDDFETTLTVVDPTADRTITFPNETGTVHTTGGDTTHTNIIIADGGNIGSASDTNAIGISSGGVVSVTATTANTSATDGALTVGGGLGVAADASIGDDLRLISDSAVLSFGADSDTTLTHTDGSGLTLNSTNKLMFNDASQFIQGASATVLDIAATDEIELTATLIDVVGNLAASGTYTGGGLMTTGGNIVIPNAGNIGSVGDTDAIAIASGGGVTLTQTLSGAAGTFSGILKTDDTTEATSTTDGSLQTDGGLSVAKDVVAGDDVKLLSDAAVLAFGADGDVTLTHVADTGLLLNGTSQLQFNDASQNITAPSGTVLDINATDEVELNATLVDVNANLDVSGTYTGGGLMTTGGNIVIPDAGTIGSASATSAMTVASTGIVTFVDDIIIKDGGTIGAASATGAITISSGGIVTLVDDLIIKDGGTIGSASDVDAIAIGSDGDVTLTQDLELQHDGAILSFGANDEITLTHVHDTGLLLADSGGTPTLQFHDSNESVSSDGGHLIFTSNGVAFDFPSADGSSGQVIKTNGSGVLSFTDVTASSLAADDLAAGDAAVILTTSSGNITVDAAANDTDIIFKGTDGGADTTFLTIDGSDAGTLIANHNLELGTDASAILFGADNEVTLTHVADKGVALKHTATADDKPIILTLQTGETDIAADDVIGQIDFQAPDEGTGTDAITVCAGIAAVSEGDFAADNNATKLSFKCGASEAATEKMSLSSAGLLTIADDLVIKDGGTIGVASDADAITIASNGQLTLTQTLIGTALDISGDIDVDGTTNLDVVDIDGAVDMASTLGVTGVVTANAGVVVDNITIDGTEIDLSSGDLTLDVAGDIILDADGAQVRFQDATTERFTFNLDATPEIDVTGGDFTIHTNTSDADFIVTGNDGGSGITAMTLDMSAAGAATFNNDVTAFSDERLKRDIETIPNALDKVCQMRGVTFERIDDEGRTSMGVIAQEIEKIIPEVVREDSSEDKIKSVAYGNMVGVLIEAIKELKSEIEELKKG